MHRMVSTNAGGGFVILLSPPKITLLSLVLVLTCVFTQTRDIKSCQYSQNVKKKNLIPARGLYFLVFIKFSIKETTAHFY